MTTKYVAIDPLAERFGKAEAEWNRVFNDPAARGRFKEGMSIAQRIYRGVLWDMAQQAAEVGGTEPTVLVVRHPDTANDITVSPAGSVNVVEADLGSSFDGQPNPDDPDEVEVAREII